MNVRRRDERQEEEQSDLDAAIELADLALLEQIRGDGRVISTPKVIVPWRPRNGVRNESLATNPGSAAIDAPTKTILSLKKPGGQVLLRIERLVDRDRLDRARGAVVIEKASVRRPLRRVPGGHLVGRESQPGRPSRAGHT
jgi:hypothetical protein